MSNFVLMIPTSPDFLCYMFPAAASYGSVIFVISGIGCACGTAASLSLGGFLPTVDFLANADEDE